MLVFIQNILGIYTQLPGEGIATINWEYITGSILLIMSIWLCFKFLLTFINALFKLK